MGRNMRKLLQNDLGGDEASGSSAKVCEQACRENSECVAFEHKHAGACMLLKPDFITNDREELVTKADGWTVGLMRVKFGGGYQLDEGDAYKLNKRLHSQGMMSPMNLDGVSWLQGQHMPGGRLFLKDCLKKCQ